ncbi:6,7-dimethyl-8-ribityllumazine synthase 2 (DMRL synthase 2) (Lumazine synthase 2) (Riboflavin synthase 2 beta chain) [Herminiimonas arsenicoxydans]|uniref:6,7-dimethyl-8-ribityllumazine synthase n=1 Tax=Herminiimonas arsenicoxydans TaxID=204773 RepID=A4G6U4_HERAR|nr:6,7-dimethyl-8-ribityllumazine synthase 2 (DMRL synthase 2) (Lumazine synthase 2) (Riboflavin synthase 2 beta chain) [Herminiimonas arsenicoxydans]
MQHAIDIKAKSAARRIAFIQASWHKEIVDQCRIAFVEEMAARGYSADVIDFFEVAGAFEIPLHAKVLAKSGRYAAIVGTGLVVDGGVYRHEFVSQAVISGLMQVQLETEVPVISAVLTPHHFHSHDEHQGFFFQHFLVKGKEAAHACADTIQRLQQIDAMTQERIAA